MKLRPAVNIDTVTFLAQGIKGNFILPRAHKCVVINPDGVLVKSFQNRVVLPGRQSIHSMNVSTSNEGAQLKIEGSPFARLTGQNLITSSDMKAAAKEVLHDIFETFQFDVSEGQRARYEAGDLILLRADLAVNFTLESEKQCTEILRQIRVQLEAMRGTTRTCETTVYWAPKNSKEYSIAFYAKGPQMRRQKRFNGLSHKDQLLTECESILRVEVRLQAQALRDLGLDKVSKWKEDSAFVVFSKYMRRLRFFTVTSGPLTAEELKNLPNRALRPVLALHKSGVDLSLIYSPSTLQRHKTNFKKLKIDLNCPNQSVRFVKPLTKILSPKRAMKRPPKWMVRHGLIHASAIHSCLMNC